MNRFINISLSQLFSAVIAIALSMAVLFACEQFDPERIVKVETVSIENLDATSCTAQGLILDTGEDGIDQHGFCWSEAGNPSIEDNRNDLGPKGTKGSFSGSLTGLSLGTRYNVRAYATNSIGTSYGSIESFTTHNTPTIKTLPVSSLTNISAETGGNIADNGGAPVTARGVCWSTTSGPTISDSKTTNGSETGSYTSSLTGLSSNTRYYVRAYATNSIGTGYGNEVIFTTYSGETVTDYDGNIYYTIQIGDQLWMANNLKVTHYSDGTAIPLVEDDVDWVAVDQTERAYCYYRNEIGYANVYGALYTWAAAMNGAASSDAISSGVQGVCPDGWHLPSDAEWKELEKYLGLSQAEADAMLFRGTDEGSQLAGNSSLWDDGALKDDPAFGSSGFTFVPAGGRASTSGVYMNMDYQGYLWSTTEDANSNLQAYTRYLDNDTTGIYRQNYLKDNGCSVRCVKD